MASQEAQMDYHGNMAEWKTAEGVSVEIPFRTDQDEIFRDIKGGLRSGLTYGGAATIREMQRKLDYRLITQSGFIESQAHAAIPKNK